MVPQYLFRMIMKKKLLVLLATTLLLNHIAYAEEDYLSDEQKLLAKVNQVYVNYSHAHSNCGYQSNPSIKTYPQQMYLLTNPYPHSANEINSINFKINNFVLDGHSGSRDPFCGTISIKCASYISSTNYYCERIHNGRRSNASLLADPRYNKYLAYQTIYNLSVMPRAQKNFGLLKQFSHLNAFPHHPSSPNLRYEYDAVIYSTIAYPALTNPPSPNYSSATNDFFGSAENLKSVCKTIQKENLSLADAAVRFNQFFGIPPDSPDVVMAFTFFKLRTNPHVFGKKDGNMFRPCPNDGNIETTSCTDTALAIPHHCNMPPSAYDGTTLNSFLANFFYTAYCNTIPQRDSGMPLHYPWTGQGFTYDWYPWNINLSHVQGDSEYVPAMNGGSANIEVINKKSIKDFLSTCDFT